MLVIFPKPPKYIDEFSKINNSGKYLKRHSFVFRNSRVNRYFDKKPIAKDICICFMLEVQERCFSYIHILNYRPANS